ncbi:SH3-like domain-containing protein [Arenibacter algicola]|uniref:GW dipeptide domain-containing protein n=1 Tax=Arenibacter algicola TaxID=616991 RepID=UPI001C07075C|nr:GW dipeptide domain-containing protein [Arenibacter algicola]MBU2904573.1 SH3-like domain-containing protein [Arenibacter algicola]
MDTMYKYALLTITLLVMFSCNNGPKVISPSTEDGNTQTKSGIFSVDPETQVTPNNNAAISNDFHKVVVNEVLPTSRYVYLRVTEGGEKFWIATRKQEVEKGEVYFYRNGLLKTNFESKEYNKVFDTIYLISNLVAEDHAKHVGNLPPNTAKTVKTNTQKEDIPTHTNKVVEHKGTLKIAELVKDFKKYEGHTVQISGKCVKSNANIMGRNWIHIQDGSKNDFDLVVTSNTFVPEGEVVTFRAVVGLNRDFGAGYKYDLILENGTLVQ